MVSRGKGDERAAGRITLQFQRWANQRSWAMVSSMLCSKMYIVKKISTKSLRLFSSTFFCRSWSTSLRSGSRILWTVMRSIWKSMTGVTGTLRW